MLTRLPGGSSPLTHGPGFLLSWVQLCALTAICLYESRHHLQISTEDFLTHIASAADLLTPAHASCRTDRANLTHSASILVPHCQVCTAEAIAESVCSTQAKRHVTVGNCYHV